MTLRFFIFCLVFLGLGQALATEDSSQTRLNILTSFPPEFYIPFKQAFEQLEPGIRLNIRNKKTTAGVAFLQRKADTEIDIFWASAPDAFSILARAGLLQNINDIEFPFPPSLQNFPLKADTHVGFALSGYGIMLNKTYLRKYQLDYPQSWADLARPEYYSHLALSSPSRSGTTHLMIETILQTYGWKEGWRLILQIGGNAATITARSYGVPEGVQQGRFGLGFVIDFLSQRIESDNIEFIYAAETHFLPASIAMLKQSQNRDAATTFIEFVLSPPAQKLLQHKSIARLPIDPAAYATSQLPLNPFSLEPTNNAKTFDSQLSQQRYPLINLLFDHFITFQLSDLKRIHGKLIRAQLRISNNPELGEVWQTRLQQAREMLTRMPLSEAMSQNSDLLLQLRQIRQSSSISGFLPSPLAKLKQDWSDSLQQSEAIIDRLLAQ